MKYCPNCGEPLEDVAAFCPVCGEKLPETPAPAAPAEEAKAPAEGAQAPAEGAQAPAEGAQAPAEGAQAPAENASGKKGGKRKSKAGLIIAIAAVVLLGALAALYFTGAYTKLLPASRTKLALAEKQLVDKALDDLFEAQDKYRSAKEVKAHIDLTAGLDSSATGLSGLLSETSMLSALLEQVKVGVDLDGTLENGNAKLGVEFKGNPVLDMTVTHAGDKLGLYVPQLDENYYTIGLKALAEKIAGELGEDEIDTGLLEGISSEPLDEQKTRAEVLELLAALSKASTRENTEVEKAVEETLIDGMETRTVDRYTVAPAEEDLVSAFKAMGDVLGKEGCYLAERLAPLYSAVRGGEEYAEDDTGEQLKTPESLADFLRENAEYFAKKLAEKNLKVTVLTEEGNVLSHRFATDDESVTIERLEEVEMNGKTYTRTYFEDRMSFEGEEIMTESVLYDISRTDKSLEGTVTQKTDGEVESVTGINLDLTKTSALGTHAGKISSRIYPDDDGISIVIDSGFEGEAMVHNITVDPGTSELLGEDVAGLTLTAKITEGEDIEAPTAPGVDLSDKSLEEIGGIFEDMLMNLAGTLGKLFLF